MTKRQRPIILIVEDEQVMLKILTSKLIDKGYQITAAIDGKTALDMASCNMPDLILLDIMLPTMDGFEILKKLKENKATKDIPVLILSNLGQEENIQKGKDLGAVDYLIKAHIDIDEVAEKIDKIAKYRLKL